MPRKTEKIIYFSICAAIFILMEVAAIGMLKNSGPLQNIWISSISHKFRAVVWGTSGDVKNYLSLKKQNDSLAEENTRLKEKLLKFEVSGAEENESPSTDFLYIPATIVKMDRDKQHNYVIIDKGSEDGVRPKCGIISDKGVIGIIDAVEKHFSYGISFLNSNTSISSKIGMDGSRGPLIWSGKGRDAIMKEISLQTDFAIGDTVRTSGFSSIFPPDIPLGTISSSKIVNGTAFEVGVTLFEDYSSVRYVSVVINETVDEINNLVGIEEKEAKE